MALAQPLKALLGFAPLVLSAWGEFGLQSAEVLGQELMLKLAHGVASWLVGQKIPLLQVRFAFPRPPHDIGFDDPTAFQRAFRHWTGSTPGAYRRGT
ncbi:hypothetical protein OKW40_007160 [Paraburkholderia sp. RAU6.4a]